ncbi:MAG: hypothetical protein KGM44_11110 [bacterium]|nr:hypothetical protein [bacterium]
MTASAPARLHAALQLWQGWPSRVRGLLVCAAALCAVAAAAMAFATRDTSVPLFAAPLRPPQVAEVGDRLAAWGIPFRVSGQGIEVPRALRQATLLHLSLAGVPHRPLPDTLDALADAGPLVPERVLEVRQRAGLEGEIAQGLRTLDGVTDARVIVAPGHDGTFADESPTPTTASVRLSLRSGERLDERRVRAVRDFVAASVAGLASERVHVLDDRGSAFDGAASSIDQDGLRAQLQSALDQVEGAGTTIVRLHVVRDDDAREIVQRRVLPAGGALRSESTQEEYHGGQGSYRGGRSAVEDGSVEREEHATLPAGRLRRLSVAVFVDRSRGGDLSKIRALVEAAAGIDVRRGDEVRVEAMAFARPPGTPPRSPLALLAVASLPALFLGLGLAAAAWAALPVARAGLSVLHGMALRRAVEQRPPALAEAQRLRAALDVEPPHAAAAVISALPASTAVAVLDLYPAEERERIVRRMATARAEAIPSLERIIGKYS